MRERLGPDTVKQATNVVSDVGVDAASGPDEGRQRSDACEAYRQRLVAGAVRLPPKGFDDMEPLFAFTNPLGMPSPSPSLLVERYDFSDSQWHTHQHVDQVIALYLKPTEVLHALDSSGHSDRKSVV